MIVLRCTSKLLDRLKVTAREDRVLVTSNVHDFEALAKARELHAGIVLIEIVKSIAAALVEHGSLVNEVLRVEEDGAMRFEQIPPAK